MGESPPKKVLVMGATGLLGPYIADEFSKDWQIFESARVGASFPCDATDKQAVCSLLEEIQPDAVIHLTALTNIEECEQNPGDADLVNRGSVENVISFLPSHAHFIYISTDQVYPDSPGPHREDEEAPENIYGLSKLAGEKEALKHDGALILRTNLFGLSKTPARQSLSDFFIYSFQNRKTITLFEDVFFSPLHMETLAQKVKKCTEEKNIGVYNLGSHNGMSKADFARAIATLKGLDVSHAHPGKSGHVEGRAHRAKDLRMDVSLIERQLDIKMPCLEKEIRKL